MVHQMMYYTIRGMQSSKMMILVTFVCQDRTSEMVMVVLAYSTGNKHDDTSGMPRGYGIVGLLRRYASNNTMHRGDEGLCCVEY